MNLKHKITVKTVRVVAEQKGHAGGLPSMTFLDIPPHCLEVLGHWLQLSVTSLAGQQGY